jgi:hypothetical protein
MRRRMSEEPETYDWRAARKSGMGAIAAGFVVAALLWAAVYYLAPPLHVADSLDARMLFALKCVVVATLFCLVAGVEAVAHERLQSAAFDPLAGAGSRRLNVNQRYLQNTLEQTVVFAAAVFGLAAYAEGESGLRAVLAFTIVWIAARWAFWIGYHRSAAMRGLGAPGMALALVILTYVAWRIGLDIAGMAGGGAIVAAFVVLEAILFRTTRSDGS